MIHNTIFFKKWVKGQCRHLCLFCKYYEDCKYDFAPVKKREREIHDKIKEKNATIAEWIPYPEMSDMYHDYYRCSACGLIADGKYPYCHCGALMK